jgi:hypothetical protein
VRMAFWFQVGSVRGTYALSTHRDSGYENFFGRGYRCTISACKCTKCFPTLMLNQKGVIGMRWNAAIAVLLDQGRDAAVSKMEMLHDLAVARGFHVLQEVFRETPIGSENIVTFYHVKAVFVDKMETLGLTQKQCMRCLNRLFRNGVQRVYILTDSEDFVEIDRHTLEALRLFSNLDFVFSWPKHVA